MDSKELEKAFDGDLDLILFYLAWVKHGLNASKAYKELHPDVDDHSARVLGSRQLAKVNKQAVMAAYGLDIDKYFEQLKAGMGAIKSDMTGQTYPDHKVRDSYHSKLGQLLGLEKGSIDATVLNNTQNNYYNLTDDQLDQLIDAKGRQTRTVEAPAGEGTEDSSTPT